MPTLIDEMPPGRPLEQEGLEREGTLRPSLVGLGRDRLREALAGVGVPDRQLRMRTNQLWSWIYARGVTAFDEMTDLSKQLRGDLDRHFTLARPCLLYTSDAADDSIRV